MVRSVARLVAQRLRGAVQAMGSVDFCIAGRLAGRLQEDVNEHGECLQQYSVNFNSHTPSGSLVIKITEINDHLQLDV